MLHTEKTDQAYQLLRSYASTPGQSTAVDEMYVDILAEENDEDRVIMMLIGYILDGLKFGNWFWLKPEAKQVQPTQTVTGPEHGYPHIYGKSSKGAVDLDKNQW